jgi:MYXO-CTERM domain-containing protein
MPSLSRSLRLSIVLPRLGALFVFGALAVLAAAPASAQTSVPAGALTADATWTAAGSPYVLAGSVTIPEGLTLRIEAGVEVQVPPSRNLGVAGGHLAVVGSEAAPVTLRSTSAGARWTGILSTTGVIDLEHVAFVDVITAIDTQNGGSLRFVTIPNGSPVNVRGGNLSIRDSEIGPADFSGTGTTSTFRSIFRGAVFFRGARAFVDHATFVGDVTGSGGADIFDSIVVQPRDLDCACVLDRVLVHPRSRGGTSVVVDEIRNPLEQEAALLSAELRPTSRSPARFRDSTGNDLGARPYAGELTATLEGWLWDDVHLTRENAEGIEGDLTVPAGHALTVDPGVSFTFPFGADELGYELRVFGTMTWGTSAGPPVRFGGTPTRDGDFEILVERGGVIALSEVVLEDTRVVLGAGASATISDLDSTNADAALVAQNGSTFTFDRVRVSGQLGLHGSGVATNLHVRAGSTGLSLSPSTGDRVEVGHATIQCARAAGTTGVDVLVSGAGSASLAHSVITGCGVGMRGSATGLTVASSIVGGNTADLMGITMPAGVTLVDPRLDAAGLPMPSSPCLDAASGSSVGLDVDGVARPVDGDAVAGAVADVGAFELGVGTCGDGATDPGERCDGGASPGYGWDACAADCRGHGPYCGDGLVTSPDEDCEGVAGCTSSCRFVPSDAGVLDDAALDPDAGTATTDAGFVMDSGAPDAAPSGEDASVARDAANAGDAPLERDAHVIAEDAGAGGAGSGCGCRAHDGRSARGGMLAAMFVLATLLTRRRRARRSRPNARGQ